MRFLCCVFLFCAILFQVDSYEVFGRYSGKKTDKLERQCSIDVKPCTPYEGSRVDGTCNNYKRPSRGSARGPYLRLLKPEYGNKGELRRDKHGDLLPSARKVRTMIHSDGRVTGVKSFNMAAAHFFKFINDDISALNGPLDFLRKRTYCCKKSGLADPRCEPIYVPHDDPYLRMTDIRCMNFSRAETFQDIGCISEEADPEQINYQTPLLDLSTVYGVDEKALKGIRLFEHGLLREAKRKGRYVPLNETSDVCFQNRNNNSVCYKFGFPEVGNFDLTTTTITIFFYREHNRIARILQELNPCWKDDRLFKVARQINIATASNIFLYELLPLILGFKNMQDFHLISEQVEFVSIYDENTDPLVFAEYEIAKRFFHTLLDGRLKKYDENYHYVGEFSLSDALFRQELIEKDGNFEELNRGTFLQDAARIDDIQDPDVSEKFYSQSLQFHDQIAEDIQRGRDLGLQGYNGYRQFCGLKPAKKFDDLKDVMSEEKVEALKRLYKDLEDIDLLVGIMSEELIPGLYVGPTLFCVIVKQIQVFRFSDRFWFERGKQYHSFSLAQLKEIRKTNMARFACDNAGGIKYIQPNALINVQQGNEPLPCSYIVGADFSKWKDPSCDIHPKKEYYNKPHIGHSGDSKHLELYSQIPKDAFSNIDGSSVTSNEQKHKSYTSQHTGYNIYKK